MKPITKNKGSAIFIHIAKKNLLIPKDVWVLKKKI